MSKIEELKSKESELRLKLIAHITRSLGSLWAIDTQKMPLSKTIPELIEEIRRVPLGLVLEAEQQQPEVEHIDLRIDVDQVTAMAQEIRSIQDEIKLIRENGTQ